MEATEPIPPVSVAPSGYQIIVDPDVFTATAATFIGRRIAALTQVRSGSIAVSGGSTPGPIYRQLALHKDIDWSRIDVFFTDERVVPYDDPASNYRLARENLLDRVPIPEEQIHPMPVESRHQDAAARAYGDTLPNKIDILILGIGQDGHTASLFPHSPALKSEQPIARTRAPLPPYERLSITPMVIAAARLRVVLVRGPEKGPALKQALLRNTSWEEWPARMARKGVWILGRDAMTLPRSDADSTP